MSELQTLESIIKNAPENHYYILEDGKTYLDKDAFVFDENTGYMTPVHAVFDGYSMRALSDIEKQIDQLKEVEGLRKKLASANKEIERLKHFDSAINIILDNTNPPYPIFVEIENDKGESITIGEWSKVDGIYNKIRITLPDIIDNILI